jgi:hypothetical protein
MQLIQKQIPKGRSKQADTSRTVVGIFHSKQMVASWSAWKTYDSVNEESDDTCSVVFRTMHLLPTRRLYCTSSPSDAKYYCRCYTYSSSTTSSRELNILGHPVQSSTVQSTNIQYVCFLTHSRAIMLADVMSLVSWHLLYGYDTLTFCKTHPAIVPIS